VVLPTGSLTNRPRSFPRTSQEHRWAFREASDGHPTCVQRASNPLPERRPTHGRSTDAPKLRNVALVNSADKAPRNHPDICGTITGNLLGHWPHFSRLSVESVNVASTRFDSFTKPGPIGVDNPLPSWNRET